MLFSPQPHLTLSHTDHPTILLVTHWCPSYCQQMCAACYYCWNSQAWLKRPVYGVGHRGYVYTSTFGLFPLSFLPHPRCPTGAIPGHGRTNLSSVSQQAAEGIGIAPLPVPARPGLTVTNRHPSGLVSLGAGFAGLIVEGTREGFRIGFDYGTLRSSGSRVRNMMLVYEHPKIVSDYLRDECRTGLVLGPLLHPLSPHLAVSSFGVIPKWGRANKRRLIIDLLSLAGSTFGLRCLEQACANLGFVLASEKTEGPMTMLTVLGIEFDTEVVVLRLSEEKLIRLRSMLRDWHTRSRGDLESLVGVLHHASKVVRPGCCFLRCL